MTEKSDKIHAQIKILKAKREQFITRLKNAYDLVPHLKDPTHRNNFLTRYQSIPDTKLQLEEIIDRINLLSLELDANFQPDYSKLTVIDDFYCSIQNAKARLATPADPEASKGSEKPGVKLPKLELPRFSGNPLEWPIFFESFNKSIHGNPSLTDSDRVQYLVGKLSGKALTAISGVPATAENYPVMWNLLIEKFDDRRDLALSYLNKMFNFRTTGHNLSSSLEAFLENFAASFEALKRLKLNDMADFIVLHLASTKISPNVFHEFEMSETNRKREFVTFADLTQFLKEKIRALERSKPPSSSNAAVKQVNRTHSLVIQDKKALTFHSPQKCKFCNIEGHKIYRCIKFLKLSPQDRLNYVQKEDLCLNCLSTFHRSIDCKSQTTCHICQQPHNSLLHVSQLSTPSTNPGVSLCNTTNSNPSSILLSTAVVKAMAQTGPPRKIRVLLDSGSQPNLITLRCAKFLGLTIEKFISSTQGVGEAAAKILGKTSLSFTPHFSNTPTYFLEFYVVSKIAGNIPRVPIDVSQLPHVKNLVLADANFAIPGKIDALIGAELYATLLKPSKVADTQGSCVALDTTLGYVITGKAPQVNLNSQIQSCCFLQTEPLETLVNKFWALENIAVDETLSDDDKMCEQLFVNTVRRDQEGRYMVDLPFKDTPSRLGNSWNNAERRFLYLEKRFSRDPDLYRNYSNEIQKLLDLEYIRSTESKDGYFIPHHGVMKESSSTPLRIVFDASSKTDTGVSLNDLLHTGPKLQADISAVLTRFRLFAIAMLSDVRQMYLRILLNPDHRKFQKLIWRFNPKEPLGIFEFTRVVFGVKSSPFLALRTIQQLASDEALRFPLAVKHIPTDMYVDDLAVSIPTVKEGIQLFKESIGLFKAGGFDLVKWSTNNDELLEHIPLELRKSSTISFDPKSKSKVLGLIWNPQTDLFTFDVHPRSPDCTKRNVLSTLARIFDPLGFLGPVTLYVKCLIKDLWELKLDWDDHPPDSFKRVWQKILLQLPSLSKIVIPRHVAADSSSSISLIGFCDGSKKGYGAVVYMRTVTDSEKVNVSLLTAKSRVSPLSKSFTIPQCELSSAWLLSRLLQSVVNSVSLRIRIDEILAFSDSTITLSRIKAPNLASEVFVRNRVTKIREQLSPDNWFYISTKDNPADCLSKGLLPHELVTHPLWWHGPQWLEKSRAEWPIKSSAKISPKEPEPLHTLIAVEETEENPIFILASRCSSWKKFAHATVFLLRFCKKLRSTELLVQPEELEVAEHCIFKSLQRRHFQSEIRKIEQGKLCSRNLQKLQPFIEDGLLRVGGRLRFSNKDYQQKHPILLPKSHHIVKLLVQFYHKRFFHAGPQLLFSLLRQKFWIISCRTLVRKVFHECYQCFKAKPKSFAPPMADLPKARVCPSSPFSHTGVDYTGPFSIVLRRGRGQRPQKGYVCLFICFATKGVHLELAPDLSTSAFLNALKRFLSRRGHCTTLYSDQGTNLVGAKRKLDEIFSFLTSKDFKEKFLAELTIQKITWKFNPPASPHFGGIWEANIAGVKTHLRRIIGNQILSLDEFSTVLTQVEAILNSRPLTVLSEDPADPLPLTPSHFLTAKPLAGLPSEPVSDCQMKSLSRPQLLDFIVQHFWTRWSREYLHTLQQRSKWLSPTETINPGTIVLLGTENAPPLQWPLGVVEEVFPGEDGVTRVVQVRTNKGRYRRPVVKLYPLPKPYQNY